MIPAYRFPYTSGYVISAERERIVQRITKAFHKYMTEQPPWTMREGLGMAGAALGGLIVFIAAYRLIFNDFFTTFTPGPHPLMVWVSAAICLAASIIPRVMPETIATYPRVLIVSFVQGFGLYAMMGLAMSYFDTWPFPFSAIGYIIVLFGLMYIARVPYRSKQTQ